MIPYPDNLDFGWAEFMNRIDALVMGVKLLRRFVALIATGPIQNRYLSLVVL